MKFSLGEAGSEIEVLLAKKNFRNTRKVPSFLL